MGREQGLSVLVLGGLFSRNISSPGGLPSQGAAMSLWGLEKVALAVEAEIRVPC